MSPRMGVLRLGVMVSTQRVHADHPWASLGVLCVPPESLSEIVLVHY